MEKISFKPGFEFIFALSILAIFCWPLLVLAQNDKDVKVIIINGDTTINGKKLNELSPADRKEVLKGFPDAEKKEFDFVNPRPVKPGETRVFTYKRRDFMHDSTTFKLFNGKMDTSKRRMLERYLADNRRRMRLDSNTERQFAERFNSDGFGGVYRMPDFERDMNHSDRMPVVHPRMEEYRMPVFGRDFEPGSRSRLAEGPGSENNHFTHIDKDGILTHISFSVTDASKAKAKEIVGAEVNNLELLDLNVLPEFSSGKTVVMFNLPAKTLADVKLTDSEGKTIWVEKTLTEAFSKNFALPLNGIYYLSVKQSGKACVKRIVKE